LACQIFRKTRTEIGFIFLSHLLYLSLKQ